MDGTSEGSFFAVDLIGGGADSSSSMSGQSNTEVADLSLLFLEAAAEIAAAAAAEGADVAAPLAPLVTPRAPRPLPLAVGGDAVVGSALS